MPSLNSNGTMVSGKIEHRSDDTLWMHVAGSTIPIPVLTLPKMPSVKILSGKYSEAPHGVGRVIGYARTTDEYGHRKIRVSVRPRGFVPQPFKPHMLQVTDQDVQMDVPRQVSTSAGPQIRVATWNVENLGMDYRSVRLVLYVSTQNPPRGVGGLCPPILPYGEDGRHEGVPWIVAGNATEKAEPPVSTRL